jgi:hypothetical protein
VLRPFVLLLNTRLTACLKPPFALSFPAHQQLTRTLREQAYPVIMQVWLIWIVLIPPKWCKLCEPDLRASQFFGKPFPQQAARLRPPRTGRFVIQVRPALYCHHD